MSASDEAGASAAEKMVTVLQLKLEKVTEERDSARRQLGRLAEVLHEVRARLERAL